MKNKSSIRRSTALLLIAVSLVILTGCRGPVEIVVPEGPRLVGTVDVGGAISVPGYYAVRSGDTLETLVRAAGGTTGSADFNHLRLYIPESHEKGEPQKIDLNRAETWLLEALPAIGETLAQRIVAYRKQNGPFRNIKELTRVEGIGTATYDRIKGLITVSD